ncbi:hypothetical protein QVD17_12038 [Tagetes erecta]|uniref:Uncharacterized protein n=1 Tax=Tagetes erecta TaxID=13708 RepID=A0AAD8KUH2_TARER|nr:hypothetical protein QVD17_12038 [Tagetes erecta]
MTTVDMRQWLQSRHYPYKTLKKLKKESLKKIVVSFQASEKIHNRMFFFDYNNPQSLLSKGQSVANLLDSMIVLEKSKDVQIIAWKYYELFDAFLIKRVNGFCDIYHYYSSIYKLPVQDLKELHKLRLITHTRAERGEKCAMLLDAGISRMAKFLEFRGQQEDKIYLDRMTKKKKMAACNILTKESKPRQTKRAEKFKSCIEEAIKKQEEFVGKQLLKVKDEPKKFK